MRWLLLALLASACVRHPPDARRPVAAVKAERPVTTVAASAAIREAEAQAGPAAAHQDSLEAMDEQIYEATMYCIDSRPGDCPGGFSCIEGACEPQS